MIWQACRVRFIYLVLTAALFALTLVVVAPVRAARLGGAANVVATSPSHSLIAVVAGDRSRSHIRIFVRELPARLKGKIVVAGPAGYHRRLTRGALLSVRPGRYTVSAGAVQAGASSYFPTVPRHGVRVRPGRTGVVTVSYGTRIPNSTRVVPPSATVSLSGESGGPRVLTVRGVAAHHVAVGDYLASGVSAAAPDGYLVKVTSLSRHGGEATLQVQNASLLEAVPQGEINLTAALPPPAEVAAAHPRSGPTARAAGFSLKTANLTCATSAGVHLENPTVTFSPSISLDAHWGFLKLDSATLSATVAASLSMGASADAGAKCATNEPGIGLLAKPIKLPNIDVQVGPVPVVIEPQLQVYLSGEASITAKAAVSLSATAAATVGVTYEHGSFHPFDSFPAGFNKSFTTEGNASAEIGLRPTVDTLVYGVAGPTFDIGAAAKFEADIHASPWWKLQGCLQAGIGFVFDLLHINWSDPHLLNVCKTLLTASTPAPTPPPPPTTSGGGGGATPPASTITFDGSPGTGSPPETLGGFTMQPVVDLEATELGEAVSEIEGPTGPITFATPVTYYRVAEGWETWSNGYTGAVFVGQANSNGIAEATIELPPGTGAFYLYAEPDAFEDFNVMATAQDGTTSGPTTVFGEAGARYYGFYAACGSRIASITVTDGELDPELGVGEFGIAPAKAGC